MEIPDISPHITLPASGDGYAISTVSHVERRIPADLWREQSKRGIVLMSDDWAKLKYVLLKNCLANECKQAVGTLDSLFLTIDSVLSKLPIPKGGL